MKRKFIVFRAKQGGTEDGGPLPESENELKEGGGGNAERSGSNEQADASRGDKLANGQDAPDYYKKAHQEKQSKATKVPDIVKKQTGQNQ
jgi:hypothetical protein